jgi:hypothetical protein
MQSWYAARFEREMGCTQADLIERLPGACGDMPLQWLHNGARIDIGAGTLTLAWQALAPRRIALLNMPRLAVSFDFAGVDEAVRQNFMRHFDLFTQRGGG